MDRLEAMRVFIEVAQSGSFSATANKLDMSRAMVTRYVNELEQWLQARLLQRTTRKISLTDAGEQCLRRSLQILALTENIQEETHSSDGSLRGQLRLTCSTSFAYAHLAAMISRFLDAHPHLKIDLQVGDNTVNLIDARIDLAIRISVEPDPLLVGRPLTICESVLVASPAYLKQAGTPKHPEDLTQHRCLSHANFGKTIWHFEKDKASHQVYIDSHYCINDATILAQVVAADGGIALLPTYLMNRLLKSSAYTLVLPEWKAPQMTIYGLFPSRRHLSPAVRALMDFFVVAFKENIW